MVLAWLDQNSEEGEMRNVLFLLSLVLIVITMGSPARARSTGPPDARVALADCEKCDIGNTCDENDLPDVDIIAGVSATEQPPMDDTALIFEMAPTKNNEDDPAIESGCGPAMALTVIRGAGSSEVAALRIGSERPVVAITKLGHVVVTISEPATTQLTEATGGDTSPGI